MSDLLENDEEFEDTPSGWQARFEMEFTAAKKELKRYHALGDKIIKRFLDERTGAENNDTRLNLFSSDVRTIRAVMYGKTPQVDVGRRFLDANDDAARVAGQMLQRLLNTDIERRSDDFRSALKHSLDDFLLPGLGVVRVAYSCEFEEVPEVPAQLDEYGNELAPAVPATQQKARDPQGHIEENVETRYVNWKDFLYSPARTFQEIRWMAFRYQLSREEAKKKFPKHGGRIPLNSKRNGTEKDARKNDPWSRADVWEIWDKDHECVWWFVEGYKEVLGGPDGVETDANGSIPDPLDLEGFWPIPEPMVANVTTSAFLPRPDYVLSQDVYEEIDYVSTKITLLERALRVAGVYDASNKNIPRLVNETNQNELIPIEGFAKFIEKGGIRGAVDWMPLDMIVTTLEKLRSYRTELMALLSQITGLSDVMRGQASAPATATEQAIKARFGSVRLQSLQEEFARFASDTQALKAEIISKHFDPETIVQRSNIQFMAQEDRQLAMPAVQLIKDRFYLYRISVKPEAVSLTDYAAMRGERSEFIQGLATFLQAAGPAMQQLGPGSVAPLLHMLQWTMAGFRGSAQIEGVLDTAIAQAEQAARAAMQQPPKAPPPDPKLLTAQTKAQGDVAKTVAATKGRLTEIHAETQADLISQAAQHHFSEQKNESQLRREALQSIDSALGRPGN